MGDLHWRRYAQGSQFPDFDRLRIVNFWISLNKSGIPDLIKKLDPPLRRSLGVGGGCTGPSVQVRLPRFL